MAGHSKWKTIKNRKGKEDARRGKIFTKMARMIMVAVKEGGPDPSYNAALQQAIDKAKAENMPNDNIDRAIKKAAGEGDGAHFEEVWYEGYGPEGIAVIVQTLTDNRNRTAPEIRHAFDKNGGNLGQTGSVMFLFERKGVLVCETEEGREEEILMQAIEAGAEDVISEDGIVEIYTEPTEFAKVRQELSGAGLTFERLDLSYLPLSTTAIEDEKSREAMFKLIDQLEENDDVQEVYHNWEVPETE